MLYPPHLGVRCVGVLWNVVVVHSVLIFPQVTRRPAVRTLLILNLVFSFHYICHPFSCLSTRKTFGTLCLEGPSRCFGSSPGNQGWIRIWILHSFFSPPLVLAMTQIYSLIVNGLNSNFKRHLALGKFRSSEADAIFEMHFDRRGTLEFADKHYSPTYLASSSLKKMGEAILIKRASLFLHTYTYSVCTQC